MEEDERAQREDSQLRLGRSSGILDHVPILNLDNFTHESA